MRQTGNKMSPQNPQFAYQNLADTLANIPQSITISFGAPRYRSHIDEFGGFVQDDWRIGNSLVLNLGVRYDYYATISVTAHPTCPRRSSTLRRRPTRENWISVRPSIRSDPYEPDSFNVGPRLGFAWTVDDSNSTVVRGGVGYLFSPHLPATVRQSVADPYVGFRVIWNRTEAVARRSRLARLQRRLPRCRPRRRGRKEDRLLRVRPGDLRTLHHSVDGERPAEPEPIDGV